MMVAVIILIVCWIWYEIWKDGVITENKRKTRENDRIRVRDLLREREERNTRHSRANPEATFTPVARGKQTVEIEKNVIPPIVEKNLSNSIEVPFIGDINKEWFTTDWGANSVVSSAEQKIIDQLEQWSVDWYREVSFRQFVTPAGGHYRYDFFIPSICTCIEYHGWEYHNTPEQKANDAVKEEFCVKNHIELVVYRRKDYYSMFGNIHALMKKHGIKRKIWK